MISFTLDVISSSFDSLGPSFPSSYESLSLKTQYPDWVEEAVNYIYTKRANDFLHFIGVKVYVCSESQHVGSSLLFRGGILHTILVKIGCSWKLTIGIRPANNSEPCCYILDG